ncbi:hypothetical protein [Parabacteroides sp. AM08-6]|uniref:hypothetical protein n=1 Tax=Parabacteroides sp. AM08-6 TaxID=2292053 RepID=UPI000EFF1199|nr:hypothetical protein [Parabacteroides sp. AM08-6]RHJ78380.1 hypothetical protein DW103_14925 [Parabacteroides sp. AM08-6]
MGLAKQIGGMNKSLFHTIKSRAAFVKHAARLYSIMLYALSILPFAAMAASQDTDPPSIPASLDISNITAATTVTYTADGKWTYQIGSGQAVQFNGTLTGTNANGFTITLQNKKSDTDTGNESNYPTLTLDGVNYTVPGCVITTPLDKTNYPIRIQTTAASTLTSNGKGSLFASTIEYGSGTLILDGGQNGLKIEKTGEGTGTYMYGIDLSGSSTYPVYTTLQGKIEITAHLSREHKTTCGPINISSATLSCAEGADIKCSAPGAISQYGTVASPFLEWVFLFTPEKGKTVEVREYNEQTQTYATPAVKTFTADGLSKAFSFNAESGKKYTLWMDGKQRTGNGKDYKDYTEFQAPFTKQGSSEPVYNLASFKIYYADWTEYASTASVGEGESNNVSVSGTTYTISSSAGLAWLAWVTNNGKTRTNDEDGKYFPEKAGFKDCTIKLKKDISMDDPAFYSNSPFNDSWIPIGVYPKDFSDVSNKTFKGTFRGTFDGCGHNISGLYINGNDDVIAINNYTSGVGLFGVIESATIQNLGVIIDERGISYSPTSANLMSSGLGGIAGMLTGQPGIISNCFVTGETSNSKIKGSNNCYIRTGGVAGYLANSNNQTPDLTIRNCYSTVDVELSYNDSGDGDAGGIAGYLQKSQILNCFATGSVKIENSGSGKSNYVAGIGNKSNDNSIISNCLALNKGLTAPSRDEIYLRRISANTPTGSNYAGTRIQLSPNIQIEGTPTNQDGANVYLETYRDTLETAWTGNDNNWKFDDTNLPQLKQTDGSEWQSTQPSLAASDYLEYAHQSLVLTQDKNDDITLNYKEGQWTYKIGESGNETIFNGIVTSDESKNNFTHSLLVSSIDKGTPTLILQDVKLAPTTGSALTINEGCQMIIKAKGNQSLTSTDASTFVNKGTLTLKGESDWLIQCSATESTPSTGIYALDNSGTLTVDDNPETTNIALSSAGEVIHNNEPATLENAWMEWRFAEDYPQESDYFLITGTDKESSAKQRPEGENFACLVIPGNTYNYWKSNEDSEPLAALQGKEEGGNFVLDFQAPAENGVSVFTKVQEASAVTLEQPESGGQLLVFCGDSAVKNNDVFPIGATLVLKNNAIPGYKLKAYTATINKAQVPSSPGNIDINDGKLIVPKGAFTITASFEADGSVTPADTTATVPVKDISDLPETPVDKPTVVGGSLTDSENNAAFKLITGDLPEEREKDIQATIDTLPSTGGKEIIYAEIALVKVTYDADGAVASMKPVQPGESCTVIYPYPKKADKNKPFVIVHLKSDGTTTVYTEDAADETSKLKKTSRGLEFEVKNFSPFGILYTKKSTPPPPPPPSYYYVTLPAVEGVTTDPAAGEYRILEYRSYEFTLTVEEGYRERSVPVVTTSRGETLEPRISDGVYVITDIDDDITVSITGILPDEDPSVDNAQITSGTKVWTQGSTLCIYTDTPARIDIYTLAGSLKQRLDIPAGETKRTLAPGLYLLTLKGKTYKIMIRE